MAWQDLSDEELVRRFNAGDTGAFEGLFRRYEVAMYRLARARVASEDAALDIVQETFLKAYQGLGKLRSGPAFRAWLYRVCLNVAAGSARSEARRRRAETDAAERLEEVGEPIQTMLKQEGLRRLQSALSRLPRLLADTLILREIEGRSYSEISEVMKCSEKAVEMRLFRARRLLRRAMAAQEGMP